MNRLTRGPTAKLLVAVLAASALTAGSTPPQAERQERSWAQYRILVDRNMFRSDRRRIFVASTRPSAPVYDSDGGIVLTGIARHDGEFVAFFEDTRANETARARVGQTVGKGKVRRITLDEVEYEREGTVNRIGIGRSLTGTRAVVQVARRALVSPTMPTFSGGAAASQPAQPTATTGPALRATSPSITTDTDMSEVLELMRRRREQELRR
jgi:hypothetical protein